MYKLLKDKNNEFQCEIMLEGASAKDAKARLFLEADGAEYVFNGSIVDNKCTIPMGKLKKFVNLLESGKIRLEIVADDTLFVPYESDYELGQEKKVTVEVIQPDNTPKKPLVEVKVKESIPTPKKPEPISEIRNYFRKNTNFDGTAKNFQSIIKNKTNKIYFNTICERFNLNKADVLRQILK